MTSNYEHSLTNPKKQDNKVTTHVSVFCCPEHGEMELLDFTGETAFCDECKKQMIKTAEFDEGENGSIQNPHYGNGRKATTQVKVFACPEHKEIELVDFKFDKAFCPCCGKEMKKEGEYVE